MFVAGAVLSTDGLQDLTRLLTVFCHPLHNHHSSHAVALRAPEDVLSYYVKQAKCGFMAPLEVTVALLMDLNTLKFVGWDTSFGKYKGHTPGAVAELERILQDNDHLAQQAFSLVVNLLHYRCSSMAWHCASWPGQLALLASPDLVDQQLGLRQLRAYHRVWQEAQALAGGSILLDKLTKKSSLALVCCKTSLQWHAHQIPSLMRSSCSNSIPTATSCSQDLGNPKSWRVL